jgi:choline dehydrogenase-like flavoprotein
MRDVVVVGAGGGGAVVAKELAERGLDVLLLEAGPRFAHPAREWTHFAADANDPAHGYFRAGPANRSRPPFGRETSEVALILQVMAVGGTTLHYFGNSPRAMPGAFNDYTRRDQGAYDRAHALPLAYRQLVPYYEWVEHTLPVHTAPMGTKEEVFLRAAARTGLAFQSGKDIHRRSYRPQPNAILPPQGTAGRTGDSRLLHFPRARGCTFCGHCYQGCMEPLGAPRNLTAKRSTDNSYIPMALTADRWSRHGHPIELITDAFVERILVARHPSGLRARGVIWRHDKTGQQTEEEARVVVLAAGAIETPRLWLGSGLPDPNGWVGRGCTYHHPQVLAGVMPFYTGASKGPGSAARADIPGRGSLLQVQAGPSIAATVLAYSEHGSGPGRRLVGNELRHALSHIDRTLGIVVLTDDDVEPANRVTLSATARDEHGPVPRVELLPPAARSRRTRANRAHLAALAARLLRAAGARDIYQPAQPPLLFHIHSTMRMGAHDRDSVLDPHAEARAVTRLFIADNSALSNALGGPNPTLTTQALATRTAERIFTRYFRGENWVHRDTPTPSTHPSVTHAMRERRL